MGITRVSILSFRYKWGANSNGKRYDEISTYEREAWRMATTFYDLKAATAQGEEKSLRDFQGKVALIVNLASECGFTPQYADLQKLYQNYKEKGFVILGFPSNDFGGQEPGTIEEIKAFCTRNYGVTFPLFDKIHAKGEGIHPVYQWLTAQDRQGDVKWNFEKFLVGKDGRLIQRFRSSVNPLDAALVEAIEKALAE